MGRVFYIDRKAEKIDRSNEVTDAGGEGTFLFPPHLRLVRTGEETEIVVSCTGLETTLRTLLVAVSTVPTLLTHTLVLSCYTIMLYSSPMCPRS